MTVMFEVVNPLLFKRSQSELNYSPRQCVHGKSNNETAARVLSD